MNQSNFYQKLFLPFLILLFAVLFISCQDSAVDPNNSEPTTNRAAFERLIDEDSSLTSFGYNYNEEDPLGFLGKITETIYPLRVGQRMRLVNRTLDVNIVGDTIAYGLLTKTFEGVLLILANYDSLSNEPDTLIKKPFSAVVTRNIIFLRTGRTPFPLRNWRIAAVSLPEGGTQSPNIDITKLTAYLPNGDSLVITSPNDFYFRRGWRGWAGWSEMMHIHPGDSVLLRVNVYSTYQENDFVTLTYGANKWMNHRNKRMLEFVSATPSGSGWDKVYQQWFKAHTMPGFFHAVLNAMPRQVVYDDSTPVESEAWGVPYLIRFN